MFWTEKADHSSPGYRWGVTDKGNITGRVYQTWPHRLKARLAPSIGVAVLMTIVLTTDDVAYADNGFAVLIIGNWIWAYGLLLAWPLWPATHRITLNPVKQTMRLGIRRFDLNEVRAFSTRKKIFKPGKFAEYVTFGYGRKTITIKVSNPPQHAFRIACHLTELREKILSGVIHPDNVLKERESRKRETAF